MKDNDVVISSRIRFARNIKDYPYLSKLDETSAREIIEKTEKALGTSYTKTDLSSLDRITKGSFVEHHRISPEFASLEIPRVLLEKGDTHIMICEEDHIRLQVIKKGFELESAYNEAIESDDVLINSLRIAYDEKLGFLTHCPTNLGTGMRASVMMFLPGLVMTGQLSSIISQLGKLGFTIRGIYGEGSRAQGNIYQISNSRTLGITEEEILSSLTNVVNQVIDYERKARERIKDGGVSYTDSLCRALGVLLYAQTISSGEFIELYSKVRLGISISVIEQITIEELDSLFTDVMPFTICLDGELSELQRDEKRARLIKEKLRK